GLNVAQVFAPNRALTVVRSARGLLDAAYSLARAARHGPRALDGAAMLQGAVAVVMHGGLRQAGGQSVIGEAGGRRDLMIVVTIRQRAVASIFCIDEEAAAEVCAGPMTQRPVEVMKLPDRFRRARQHSGDDQKCDAELAFHLSFLPAEYH